LHTLDVSGNCLSGMGINRLTVLSKLCLLRVSGSHLFLGAVHVQWGDFPSLHTLHAVGVDGVMRVSSVESLVRLRALTSLHTSEIDRPALRYLGQLPTLHELRLVIQPSLLGGVVAKLTQLSKLEVRCSQPRFSLRSTRTPHPMPRMPNLVALRVYYGGLDLGNVGVLTGLTHLQLIRCPQLGQQLWTGLSCLPVLRMLAIMSTPVDVPATSPRLPLIESLELSSCALVDGHVRRLEELARLKHLSLVGNDKLTHSSVLHVCTLTGLHTLRLPPNLDNQSAWRELRQSLKRLYWVSSRHFGPNPETSPRWQWHNA